MNFKRKRPKNRRSGCLFCKPHKSNSHKDRWINRTRQDKRSYVDFKEQIHDVVNRK